MAIDRRYVYHKYDGHCAYCGETLLFTKMTVDHFIPIRRKNNYIMLDRDNIPYGTNDPDNLMPCCGSCNSSKSVYSIDTWRDSIQRKINQLNNYSSTYRIAKRFGLLKEIDMQVKFYYENYE